MKSWEGSNWTGSNWDANNFRGPNGEAPPGTMRASLSGSSAITALLAANPLGQPERPQVERKSRGRTYSTARRRPVPARLVARLGGDGNLAADGRLDWAAWNDDDELALLLAA